ncbi:unnamed protein product [Leptidea sinapis]|uniref:beta-N-acetylhexosaminidase n=1 Tax=Leptidea sinapis TaxID=189913 RepID=A0A5E4QET0_9NEOP|nr:unnamed protein product [Leptidea sinapis]
MASVMLFHCCVNSRGQVENDICMYMKKSATRTEKDQIKPQEILSSKDHALKSPMSLKSSVNVLPMFVTENHVNRCCTCSKSPALQIDSADASVSQFTHTKSPDAIDPSKDAVYESASRCRICLDDSKIDSGADASSIDSQESLGLHEEACKKFSEDTCEKPINKSSCEDPCSSNVPKQKEEYCEKAFEEICQKPSEEFCCDSPCAAPVPPGVPEKYCSKGGMTLKQKKVYFLIATIVCLLVLLTILSSVFGVWSEKTPTGLSARKSLTNVRRSGVVSPVRPILAPTALQDMKSMSQPRDTSIVAEWQLWECKEKLCQKVIRFTTTTENVFSSMSRCILLCSGPQLWPIPIGFTYFSDSIVTVSTRKLEYKFQAVPSDSVQQYLSEAFKLFLQELTNLENIDKMSWNKTKDDSVKKMIIQIEVESDSDPRLRLDTEEAYMIKIDTIGSHVWVRINGVSFCGVRHGLETLGQLILLDQDTGRLITFSKAIVKDAPAYKYRGLMIDTGSNFIPLQDLMRTVDAMASCKLNTLHWRISSVTSFPLQLSNVPIINEYGPYDRSMVYTKSDVKSLVQHAELQGVRVVIEVTLPGPVGRPWSWLAEASCPRKDYNHTCNTLCLRLPMLPGVFDIIQEIYTEILQLTNVKDVFHLSNGIFTMVNCFGLMEDREGFLEKALYRLRVANGGILPKLPIIWYTPFMTNAYDMKTWERLGVQVMDWDPNSSEHSLRNFRVIHSSKWDLSCEMKRKRCTKYRTWQEMYGWNSWKNVEVFTIEGGEALLWTDLVDSGNLDEHLWPRAAAVAERLWSDVAVNSFANHSVYARLDMHRYLWAQNTLVINFAPFIHTFMSIVW